MTRTLRQGAAACVDGAIGGGLATVAMSLVMLGARRVGLVGELPPERMVAVALDAADQRARKGRARDALAVVLHVGFGVTTGALFGILYRRLRLPVPALPQGMIYGSLVWLVSYMGWIPALGLMPVATRDEPRRPVVMVLAHEVYGAVLGALVGYHPWRWGAPSPHQHASRES